MGNSNQSQKGQEQKSPVPRFVKLGHPDEEVVQQFIFQDGDLCWIKTVHGVLNIVEAHYEATSGAICSQEVTTFLKPYAYNGEEIKFVVTPTTIGSDPCPGIAKQLRIQVSVSNWRL